MVGLRWMLLVAFTVGPACSERVNLGEIPPRDEVYGTCESDADCAGDRCLEAAGGRLCTAMCGPEDGQCPTGSSCKTFEGFTQTGVIETRFCAPM